MTTTYPSSASETFTGGVGLGVQTVFPASSNRYLCSSGAPKSASGSPRSFGSSSISPAVTKNLYSEFSGAPSKNTETGTNFLGLGLTPSVGVSNVNPYKNGNSYSASDSLSKRQETTKNYPVYTIPDAKQNQRNPFGPAVTANIDKNFHVDQKADAKKNKELDRVQTALDIVGLFPVAGDIADAANTVISAVRGKPGEAVLSAAAMVPIIGQCATGGKLGIKGTKAAIEGAEAAEDIAKKVDKGASGAKNISPYELQKTHTQTLSKKAMQNLVDDIKVNGIKEPVKYVEYNGSKYIVDGHHRALAAKQLGIKDIPVEKVELPYGGYETIKDLLWTD